MAYSLRRSESFEEGIRRIGDEQFCAAIASLTSDTEDLSTAIHDARKRLKKVRSLIRLAAKKNSGWRRDVNQQCRDLGRRLSAPRDADVRIQTLQRLRQQTNDPGLLERIDVQLRVLANDSPQSGNLDEVTEHFPELVADLKKLRKQISNWNLSRTSADAVVKNLARWYGRGRGAMKTAAAMRSDEFLHEWRKRCKDHWYHMRLLCKVWKPVVTVRSQVCSELCLLLGDDHDLAVLSTSLPPDDILCQLIAQERSKLQMQAFRLGQLIFAESRKAFQQRFMAYWHVWKSGKHS